MTKWETYCDICGKEIDNDNDVSKRKFYYEIRSVELSRTFRQEPCQIYDICSHCHDEIAKTIEKLRR